MLITCVTYFGMLFNLDIKRGMCEQMYGSFLEQSVDLTGLMEKGEEITSNFSSLLSVEATCGI